MTLSEAESLFKKYDGHYFHMGREESPECYHDFMALCLPDSVIEQWRQEIIDHLFDIMFEDHEDVWGKLYRIIKVMLDTKTHYQKNGERILDNLSRMNELDTKQKILIIERMTECCSFICRNTDLAPRMNDIMTSFMDFECREDEIKKTPGWKDAGKRYDEAVNEYRSIYRQFH